MVKSSLRVAEEREREREREREAFTLPFQNVAQYFVVVVAFTVAAEKEPGLSSHVLRLSAVGPIISDTIIIASDTSLFAAFTTDVKSMVISLSLWITVLPSQ